MKIIKNMKTICPICIEAVDGRLIEEKGSVYLKKTCLKHGKFKTLLFKDSSYFSKINQQYGVLQKNKLQIPNKESFHVLLSYGCDLNYCICCKKNKGYLRPSLSTIKNKISSFRNARINILGAHPRQKKELIGIIRHIKKSKNVSILYSQGPLLKDESFLKQLREEGLDKVALFFDSFDEEINKEIKGRELLKIKNKALSNLKRLNIPTIINMTVLRNKNEDDVKNIIDLAGNNKFIKIVEFRGYFPFCGYGISSNLQLGNDEIISIVGNVTNQKVSKDKILIYQQLVYNFFSVMPGYLLPEQLGYILFKVKSKKYKDISDVFNIDKLKKKMDYIYKLKTNNNKFKANYLFLLLSIYLTIKLSVNHSATILFLFINRRLHKMFKPCTFCDVSLNNEFLLYFGTREHSMEYCYSYSK